MTAPETPAKVVGGTIMVAPNGVMRVRVFRHGYIEPIKDTLTPETWELIQKMSALASAKYKDEFGKHGTPKKIFEFMGWKEVTE